jgi:hypothetical protein
MKDLTPSLSFFLSVGGEDAPRRFGQLSDHFSFPIHQFFLDEGQQQQKNCQAEQDHGERHRKDDSHRYSARKPTFVSLTLCFDHIGIALSHPISIRKNETSPL